MAIGAQMNANRENSQKSTGQRTAEGTAVVSHNAKNRAGSRTRGAIRPAPAERPRETILAS